MDQKNLYEKLWDSHIVRTESDGTALLYIDRHLVHEVTSPQAFESLKAAGRTLWRSSSVVATADHNTPTSDWSKGIKDPISRMQVDTLDRNISDFGAKAYFPFRHKKQGIVHVIGPESGATLPGMTVVCGDSHTSTHGAFACLAFGIGTSEVEHVLATQCLTQKKAKTLMINVEGELSENISAKDLVLHIIGVLGTAAGTGFAIEFGGAAVERLSMEGRMTVCNMAIEAGARAGLIGVDNKTIEYLAGREMAPEGVMWDRAVDSWRNLKSDPDATYDRVITFHADEVLPQVTWGTSPQMVVPVSGETPDPETISDRMERESVENALAYMGLDPKTPIIDIKVDKVFIGSCTNSRIEDLRAAAKIVAGRNIASNIKLAMVVPGSGAVKRQAESEGLNEIFQNAGFEWREPGCSMCLAMNEDKLEAGERCASTSNRNFEGRQGNGGRTHLVSPAMAAASAVAGRFIDSRELD